MSPYYLNVKINDNKAIYLWGKNILVQMVTNCQNPALVCICNIKYIFSCRHKSTGERICAITD